MAQLQTTAVTGSLTVTGQIIAQTLNVQQVTSSIIYSSGSNRFGNLVTDVQQFTGSLRVTGSGIHYIVGGSVGIGTVLPSYRVQIDAPNADWGLHVKGVSTANNSYGMFVDAGTSASDAAFMVRSADTTTTFIRVLGNGNVGIGTGSPGQKLHIEAGSLLVNTGTNTATAYRDIMMGGIGGWTSGESHGIDTVYGSANNPTTFTRIESAFDGVRASMYFRNFYNSGTSTNILMTIRGDGNVGIGTTAPIAKLQIGGTSGNLLTVGTLTNNWAGDVAIGITNGNGVIISKINTANDTNRVLVFYRDDTNGATIWGYTPTGGSGNVGFQIRANASSYFNGGNVGIGTTVPSYKLHTVGNAYISDTLIIDGGGNTLTLRKGSGTAAMAFAGTSDQASFLIEGVAGGGMQLYTSAGGTLGTPGWTSRMYVSSSGNVGIGTTAPGYPLHVVGNIFSSTGVIATTFWTNDTIRKLNASAAMNFRNSAGTVEMIISSSGEVGIGTSTPFRQLTFGAQNNDAILIRRLTTSEGYSISGSGIAWTWSSTATDNETWAAIRVIMPGSGNTHMAFSTTPALGGAGLAERMRITSTGNVGIGTTTPSTPLHVQGGLAGTGGWNRTATLAATYPALIFNSNGSKWAGLAYDYSAAMRFWVNANNDDIFAGTQALSILNNGNIGINTSSPAYRLDVVGASRFGESSTVILSNDGTYGTGYGTVAFGGNTNGFNRVFGSTGTADGLFLASATGRGIFFRPNGAAIDRVYVSPSGSFIVGDTVVPTEVAWFGTAALGKNGTNKVIIGYLSSTTNGAVIGGHNSALNAWAELNINATNIIFRSNESETMRLLSTGNLGIGTTAPSQKLHIYGSSDQALFVENAATYQLYAGINSNIGFVGSNNNTPLSFRTAGSTRMYITTGGNVGIGVTTPAAKLQVSGSSNVLSVVGSGSLSTSSLFSVDGAFGRLFEVTDDLSNSLFSVNTIAGLPVIEAFADYSVNLGTYSAASGSTMRITGSSVGIGTTNPGGKLDLAFSSAEGATSLILRTNNSTAANGTIRWRDNANNNEAAIGSNFNVSDPGALEFISGTTTNMILRSTGDVGIGTTNPAGQLSGTRGLSIVNATNAALGLSNGTNHWLNYLSSTTYRIWNNSVSEVITILLNGNVGIGTTVPAYKLDVNGSGFTARIVGGTSSNPNLTIQSAIYPMIDFTSDDANAGNRNWRIASVYNSYGMFEILSSTSAGGSPTTSRLAIKNDGNVGIGSTSPGAKLDVVGNVRAQSFTGSLQGTASYATQALSASYAPGGASQWTTTGNNIYYTTGNVGIGTSTIARKLDIYGDGTLVRLQSPTANQFAELEFTANGAGSAYIFKNSAGYLPYGGTGSLNIYNTGNIGFHSEATFHIMTLLRGGNVGIGSNAPTQKLDVAGSVNISSGAYYKGGALNIVGSDGTSNYINTGAVLYIQNAGSTLAVVNSNGNVGIGSTAPAFKLDVAGAIRTTSNILLSSDGMIDWGSGDARIVEGEVSNYSLSFKLYDPLTTTVPTRLFMSASGNIGIGTTTPSLGRLQINTGAANNNALTIQASSQTSITYGIGIDASSNFAIYDNFSAVQRVTMNGSGNVGIGTTTPSYKLHVSGGNAFFDGIIAGIDSTYGAPYRVLGFNSTADGGNRILASSTTSDGMYFMASTGNGFRFRPNGGTSDLVTITSAGSIGVGTTAPGQKLDVIGSARIGQTSNNSTNTSLDITAGGSGFNAIIDFGYWNTFDASIYQMGYYGSLGGVFKITDNGAGPVYDRMVMSGASLTFPSSSVGIRTTSPTTAKLVIGGLAAEEGLDLSTADQYANLRVLRNSLSGIDKDMYIGYLSGVGSKLHLYSSNSETITVAGGSVGIGTTAPANTLDVAGAINVRSNGAFAADAGNLTEANFLNYTSFNGSGGDLITLGVQNTSAMNAGNIFRYSLGVTGNANGQSFVISSVTTGGTITPRLTIDTAGNVGIGTTSIGYKLDVAGVIRVQGNTTNGPLLVNGGDSNGAFVRSSIAFGFNATDGYYHWIHTRHNGGTPAGNALDFYTSDGTQNGTFPTNGVHGLTISAGSVGINTTSPATTLHVQGTATVSGSLRLSGSAIGIPEHMIVAISDETTNLTTGTGKMTMRAPFAMRLTELPRASLTTASTSGLVTVDINEAGTSVLGANKLSIDANELTSTTAATPTTIADALIADDAQMTFDIDGAGTGARGLKITLYYIRI